MKKIDYAERKKRGNEEFPLEFYYVDSSHPRFVMQLHFHSEIEIIRVQRGTLKLYLNNTMHVMREGDVRYISSDIMHRGEPERDCAYECVVFSPRLLAGFKFSGIPELSRAIISADSFIEPVCESADESAHRIFDLCASTEKYYEIKVVSLLLNVFYELLRSGSITKKGEENKRVSHRNAIMATLFAYIEENLSQKMTLAELAKVANINEKYLCRFFKDYTGTTPIDYINRTRVARAHYEITVNHMNVTEAAYECGFNELSYFSRCYKKYIGYSPSKAK